MCEPATLAVTQLAISAASTASAYGAAQAQQAAQQAQYEQNIANTERASTTNYRLLSSRVKQEDAAALQEEQDQEIEAARAAATAEVAAGGGNIGGNSVGNLLRGVYGTLGRNRATLAANSRSRREASAAELENLSVAAKNQLNSVAQPQKVSMMPYLIKTTSDGMSTYNDFQKRKAT